MYNVDKICENGVNSFSLKYWEREKNYLLISLTN